MGEAGRGPGGFRILGDNVPADRARYDYVHQSVLVALAVALVGEGSQEDVAGPPVRAGDEEAGLADRGEAGLGAQAHQELPDVVVALYPFRPVATVHRVVRVLARLLVAGGAREVGVVHRLPELVLDYSGELL